MAVSKDYGKRLVISVFDEVAAEEPGRILYSLPVSRDVSEGFRDITALQFANAVNRTAWWLEAELGKGSSFPTVGYFGPWNDFRYILLILGCIKAGYKALLPSPRNSIEASVAVLNATSCDIWVTPKERHEMLPQILDRRPMKVIEIPETDELLNPEPVKAYPYTKTFEEAASDPFCILHTSGSTGLPKPIIWKNSLIGTLDATRLLPKTDQGLPPWTDIFDEGDRFYSAFPLYHGAGLIMNIFIVSLYRTSNVLGPVGVLSTINLLDSLLDNTDIKCWSVIPSIVDEIGETPAIRAKFAKSKVIIASGGPVTYASANKATEVIRILNITGTSEGLFQGSLLVEPEDWIYFSFHPYAGFDFRQVDDDVYEHWGVRNEDRVDLYQGIFHTFPDIKELTFKDLYAPHPTKPYLWIYRGRTDDMLVMSNGEKVRPVTMEAIINSHPAVSACLMIGTGYTMMSLLVELVDPEPASEPEREALLASILETVHAANAIAPKHARVFPRNTSGLPSQTSLLSEQTKTPVKRRDTVLFYEQEIKQFYKSMEEDGYLAANIDFTSHETTSEGIKRLVVASLPSAKDIGLDDDLLGAGVDSLVAFSISNSLRSAVGKNGVSEKKKLIVTAKFVYTYPTINALTANLYNLVHNVANGSSTPVDLQKKSMSSFRAKYAAGLMCSGATVILTGSTGSLGSYLLESLVRQTKSVNKIYCLNRAEDGRAKQMATSEPRGLSIDWSPERVEFLQCDLSKPRFGLTVEAYNGLLQDTTHIIHNQWPVDYNWDISSFEPHIRGVRHLVDFSRRSNHDPSLFFVSTIATVNHLRPEGAVPEKPNHVLTTALDGYGSAKHVSELILEDAVAAAGVNASICRVGQIAGPVLRGPEKGEWGKQEWLPSLIASSKYLGVLPSTLGALSRVDWTPVDLLADIILELASVTPGPITNGASATPQTPLPVYHAVNPNAVGWDSLVQDIAKQLGGSVKIVPCTEWVDALRKSRLGAAATATQSLKQNPALKLLDFFESVASSAEKGDAWPLLETVETVKKSPRMAELKPVSAEWMNLWMEQWKF
ncbi:L-aminoadipate-semialdehyde dehydrogenase [Nannizzia gypsea CBS 118893]|uniref:L-aminoadipate-semialdehyde dehydrogenase n=1 Tax=Arthroderma gypseum (strain ATCC MYA-4604 / CBS 118893) TaxID=535722 RepID=E4V2M5_ARTGP|nr:L-aminoadipate-semialdehyde dehydrogenase [Nannizzia gypsea CBS 118893]EFR04290.1 L-aminoadipate-semialdehyde dehydrogenase [Nannizzia gypsea CBS 118893]